MNQSNGKWIFMLTSALAIVIVGLVSFTQHYVDFVGTDAPSTDGCSLFPDAIGSTDYRSCCVAHDQAYYTGGSPDDRKIADQALRTCINSKSSSFLGTLMFMGVRVGGTPYIPTTFRWNYGQDYGTFYTNTD